jgi:ABC-2 type transport system permease protein
MLAGLRKHARVWWRMAAMSFMLQLGSKLSSAGFLAGKLVRLFFFLAFIVAIFGHTSALAGYSLVQTALFFLTYNLVDITAQLFFRGIYSARRIVTEGDLDYFLVQPANPLFRMASYLVDFLDLTSLAPVVAMIVIAALKLPVRPRVAQVAAYAALVLNGILLAASFHIAVAAMAVWTQELDNAIWIYRDVMTLGRFPVDIYASPIRWALMVVVPVGVMTTFPTRALLGILTPAWAAYAFALSAVAMTASLAFWNHALARYTSVSS